VSSQYTRLFNWYAIDLEIWRRNLHTTTLIIAAIDYENIIFCDENFQIYGGVQCTKFECTCSCDPVVHVHVHCTLGICLYLLLCCMHACKRMLVVRHVVFGFNWFQYTLSMWSRSTF
jgi:hypothetical protein